MREIKSRSIILPNDSYIMQKDLKRSVSAIVIYRIEEKKQFKIVVLDKLDEVQTINVKNIGIKSIHSEKNQIHTDLYSNETIHLKIQAI